MQQHPTSLLGSFVFHHMTAGSLRSILLLCGLGLLLGMRHSTDADHVVAVSTIVTKQRSIRGAAVIGLLWGVGHTLTISAVGALIILCGLRIPARIGLCMEFSVALMLIFLGLLNLTGVRERVTRRFTAGSIRHILFACDDHEMKNMTGQSLQAGMFHSLRPLLIGLVHGLAGSAAIALLVLGTISDPGWATAYLLVFGFGTVVGMMLMTAMMAIPLTFGAHRFASLHDRLTTISGIVSVCFGVLLVYQIGFVGGLFTKSPHWTPH